MSDKRDYAHMRDPQAQRTRIELRVIIAVVVVVILGALIWRSVAHVPAKPQTDWDHNGSHAGNAVDTVPAAAAGVHPAASPPPRPIGP